MASLSIRSRLSEDLGNAAKSLKTMKLLDKLIERKLEFDKKYQMVNMTELIKENCQYEDQVKKVIGCLEVLAKYCENLLNPQALRPHKWLTISLHNQIFMEKVQPIKGHRKILEQIGYKKEERGCLIHEGEDDLNVYVVAQVYLELKAIQQELKLWIEGKHPFRELFEGLLDSFNITLTPENARLFLKQHKEENQKSQQQQQQQQQQPASPSVEGKGPGSLIKHSIKRAPSKQFNGNRSKCAIFEMDAHRPDKSKTDSETIKRRPVIFNTYSTLLVSNWVCDHCTAENEHGDKPCRMGDRPNVSDLQMPSRKLPHTCQVCFKTTDVFCPLEITLLTQARKSIMPEGAGLPPLPCHQVDVDEGALDMGMNGDFNSKMRRIQSRKAHETKLLWNNRLLHFIKILHEEVGQLPEEEIQFLFTKLQSKLSSDPVNLILQNFNLAVFEVLREWKEAEEKTLGLLKDHKVFMDKTEGEGSVMLIRACLTESSGNPCSAFQKFMEKWKNLLQALKEECSIPDLSDKDYSDVLFKCGGVIEEAKVCLIKNRYTYVIWGQEGTSLEVANDLYRDARLFDPLINRAVRDKNVPLDKRVRMLMCECDIDDAQLAKQAVGLMDSSTDGVDLCIVDFLEALEKNSIKEAGKQLMKDCPICITSKPLRSFLKMPKCGCAVCRQCIKTHFEIKIKEESIASIVCPLCSRPKIDDSYTDLDFFAPLTKLLSNILDESLVSTLGKKLAMWTLKDERVIHCPWNCGEQFTVDNIFLKVVKCPNCMRSLCLDCLNKWENNRHDCSSSHNEFRDLNLKSCPKCRQPFYLVKGGCLHMQCTNCVHEFCVECGKPFMRKGCNLTEERLNMGLHCHHPRNCHFYMRDRPAKELLELLQHYGVKIPEDPLTKQATSLPPPILVSSPGLNIVPTLKRSQSVCLSPIQKMDSGSEEICGKDLFHEELQLCCIHFVEYLCNIILHNGLDPAYIMTEEELRSFLTKHQVKVPSRSEVSGDYRIKLIEIVQVQIPLNNHRPTSSIFQSSPPSMPSRPTNESTGSSQPGANQVVVRRNRKSHGS